MLDLVDDRRTLLVSATNVQADRRKSLYELTKQGEELRGLMRLVARRGLKNIAGTAVREEVRRRVRCR